MRYVRRWNLMRNTADEDIAQHSLQVAHIAHALVLLHNKRHLAAGETPLNAGRAVELAIYHEVPELITGDLASPIKYDNPEITAAFRRIEGMAAIRLHGLLPGDLKDEYESLLCRPEEDAVWPYVKAADRICAYIKCVEEKRAGNAEFDRARESIERGLAHITLPAVADFLNECLPAYGWTLDELNT